MLFLAIVAIFCIRQTVAAYIDRAPQCNSDDCFRHLLHTPTVAAQLCTYTGTVTATITPYTTTTINLGPTPQNNKRDTDALASLDPALPRSCAVAAGTAITSRISSACSCLKSESTTVTSTVYAVTATATSISNAPCISVIPNIHNEQYMVDCNSRPDYDFTNSEYLIHTIYSTSLTACVTACVDEIYHCTAIVYTLTSRDAGTCQFLWGFYKDDLINADGSSFVRVGGEQR